jgi:hypothetical protein
MNGIEKMNEIVTDRRTRKYHEQVAAQTAAPVVSAGEAPAETGLPQRPSRKPFGSMSLKLDYPQREGFHRHWFNDIPGRVARAQEAGYEHVKGNDQKNVSRIVGSAEGGGALTAFLMEIPEEWYQQDMASEQVVIDEKEAAIRQGTLDKAEGDNRYVPSQGISIKSGSKP